MVPAATKASQCRADSGKERLWSVVTTPIGLGSERCDFGGVVTIGCGEVILFDPIFL